MKKNLFKYVLFLTFLMLGTTYFAQQFADSLLTKKGGIYAGPVEISIKLDSVQVFYTIDGTAPSSSALPFKKNLKLTSTAVVRFKVYKNGKVLGETTQTYLIGRTYDMAVISIAVNPDDFFGFERGIYVKGCCAAETPPYQGANFWKSWERVINIEFYEPNGKLGFNQMAGVRIFGGFSKGWPMKSLAVIAREKYGSNRFKHQIFPNKDIKKFKSFVLRNSGGDFNKTHFRDAFITDLVEPLDMEIQAYRPAVVYINGVYWGIHNIREKITEHYIENNTGVNKDSVDLLRHRGDVTFGNGKNYKQLLNFLSTNTFESDEKIQELNKWMDIDNYINYNIAEIYIDNQDAGGNIRYWRERKEGARWRWIFYDTDLSFGIGNWKAYKVNTLKEMTTASDEIWPNPSWSTFIIRKLLENDSIHKVYSNRWADHLNTIFKAENVIFKIDSIQNLIKNEMPYHIKKWPTLSLKTWDKNVQVLRDFATYRPSAMRGFLMEKFGWTDTIYIGVGDFKQKEGKVKLNSLTLTSSFYGWYFAGCPITIEAIPMQGYDFVKWEGLSTTSNIITIDPLEIKNVFYPVFKKKVVSQFAQHIKINELSCKQDSLNDTSDWIELYNLSKEKINISKWVIFNKKLDSYTLPEGSFIESQSYLIIANSPKKMKKYFDEIDEAYLLDDKMTIKFNSKEEAIYIADSSGNIVDSLFYSLGDSITQQNIIISKNNPTFKSLFDQFELINTATPGNLNTNFIEPNRDSDKNIWTLFKQYIFTIALSSGGLVLFLGLIFFVRHKKKKTNKKISQVE